MRRRSPGLTGPHQVRRKHAGGVLTPPASLERLEALGELEAQHELRVESPSLRSLL